MFSPPMFIYVRLWAENIAGGPRETSQHKKYTHYSKWYPSVGINV